MREFAPNLSLLVEQDEESIEEYQLEELPKHPSAERASALFSRGQSTEKTRQIQSQYFDLIREGVKEIENKSSAKNSEIIMSNKAKPFAQLESKLLALLAPLEGMYRSEKDITDAIKKLQVNFQESDKMGSLDARKIAESFPTGRGLYNALKCYRDRMKAPLPPNTSRMIYMQSELDAKADADFIEVLYQINELEELTVQELNFIQVKSSDVTADKLASIQRRHADVAHNLAENLERLNERFYPELKFKDEEDRAETLFASVLVMLELKEDENPLARLNRCIGMVSENKPNAEQSKNGAIRFEASAILQLGQTLEVVGTEEDWLIFYTGLKAKYKQYTPAKAAQSLKELNRKIEEDKDTYPHLIHLVKQIEATLPPDAIKKASTPHITPIKNINSITTIGSKVVPNGIKRIDLPNSQKYMVHRAA